VVDNDELLKRITRLEQANSKLNKELAILRAGQNCRSGVRVFALNFSKDYGEAVANALNRELSPHREFYHDDRELYVRACVNVRRCSVFVIASLYTDQTETVNDKLAKLKYFVGALKDAAAEKVIAICPYFCYARSDRKVRSREAVITKYIAQELEAVGTDRIITLDVHNLQAYQNAFRTCHSDNLEAKIDFANYFGSQLAEVHPRNISILSPDAGGMSRCNWFRQALMKRLGPEIGIAFLDKSHDENDSSKKSGDKIVGDVAPIMIIYDDMIASAGTSKLAADACLAYGAEQIWLVATHGLFVGKANERLDLPHIHKIVITDTVKPWRLSEKLLTKTEIVPTASRVAEAIRRTYTGESLSSMFES